MAINMHIGCAGFHVTREAHFQQFNSIEVQETFLDPPKHGTLARWHREAPEGFLFSIRAWQLITHPAGYSGYEKIQRPWDRDARARFGSFLPTEQTAWAWQTFEEAARILEARAIVFNTPSSFTPTLENRENMARFFETIKRDGRMMVWDPEGIWNEQEVASVCIDLDLVPAVDPCAPHPPLTGNFYFRLRDNFRRMSGYDEDDFYMICQKAEEVEQHEAGDTGFVIWDTREAAADATRFQNWVNRQTL